MEVVELQGNYVKISRKIAEWEWYKDINTKTLFFHLLLKANWKPGRFQGVDIPRGSLATSLQNLSLETGLTIRGVRTALKHLETTGEVTVKRQAKFSVVTIKKYTRYQESDTLSGTEVTQERQGSDTEVTTIEEGKKGKREEYKYNNSFSDEKLSGSRSQETDIFVTIRELYNSVCGSYPRLMKISEKRKKAIRARLKTGYTLEDFQRLFEKAEASDFLKGRNKRDWTATFDWLICDSNMAKVLEGNYDNRKEVQQDAGAEENKSSCSARLW